jgi:hypothetical protein
MRSMAHSRPCIAPPSLPHDMRSLTVLDGTHAPDAPTPAPSGCEALAALSLSRRGFVSAGALSVLASALAAACGGGGDGGTTGPIGNGNTPATGVAYAGGTVTVPLAQVPKLAASGGYLITNGDGNDVQSSTGTRPNVIIINTGADQYRAFTSICTHEQCTLG